MRIQKRKKLIQILKVLIMKMMNMTMMKTNLIQLIKMSKYLKITVRNVLEMRVSLLLHNQLSTQKFNKNNRIFKKINFIQNNNFLTSILFAISIIKWINKINVDFLPLFIIRIQIVNYFLNASFLLLYPLIQILLLIRFVHLPLTNNKNNIINF